MARYRQAKYVNRSADMVEPVIQSLISFEADVINSRLGNLIAENFRMGGSNNAFFYRGEFFSLSPRSSFKGIEVRPVARSLEPSVEIIVSRRKELSTMEQILRQTLAVVTRACRHIQDLRDALPDTLVSDIPTLSRLDRIRDEGDILADRPDIFLQYQRAVEIALQLKGKRLLHG